jgi:hypothetical protein
MFVLIFQRLVIEALVDIVYFPVWWYTRGIGYAGGYCFELLKSSSASLAPGLWLKNIFTPMYGQYDWQGRFISFFMRLVQIIIRSIALFFAMIFYFLLFLLWIIAPLIIIYGLISAWRK